MQQTTDLYKRLLADPRHIKEVRLNVAGTDYFEERLVSLSTTASLFSDGTLSAGGAVAREIDVSLFQQGDIPRMATLIPYIRLRLGDEVSEWLAKGVFYVDSRETDQASGVTTLHGFDDMLKAEQVWEPDQDLEFKHPVLDEEGRPVVDENGDPVYAEGLPMPEALEEICRLMDVKLDSRTVLNSAYTIDYPANDWTLRDVLRFIAAAHGGNFIMTDLGELRLVLLNVLPAETHYLVDSRGNAITFGGVRILV